MVVEFIVFFALLSAFAIASALRRMWLRYRDRKRARWIAMTLEAINGRPVEDAVGRFGSPFEVIEGRERTLYVWKSPPSELIPPGTGLVVVNAIADSTGQITQTSWHAVGSGL